MSQTSICQIATQITIEPDKLDNSTTVFVSCFLGGIRIVIPHHVIEGTPAEVEAVAQCVVDLSSQYAGSTKSAMASLLLKHIKQALNVPEGRGKGKSRK